jgi:hypothetical protein
MVFVNLCIFLGIPLAMLGVWWFFVGPPDPTDPKDDGDRGGWTPWG